jgi:hypothetical protein
MTGQVNMAELSSLERRSHPLLAAAPTRGSVAIIGQRMNELGGNRRESAGIGPIVGMTNFPVSA